MGGIMELGKRGFFDSIVPPVDSGEVSSWHYAWYYGFFSLGGVLTLLLLFTLLLSSHTFFPSSSPSSSSTYSTGKIRLPPFLINVLVSWILVCVNSVVLLLAGTPRREDGMPEPGGERGVCLIQGGVEMATATLVPLMRASYSCDIFLTLFHITTSRHSPSVWIRTLLLAIPWIGFFAMVAINIIVGLGNRHLVQRLTFYCGVDISGTLAVANNVVSFISFILCTCLVGGSIFLLFKNRIAFINTNHEREGFSSYYDNENDEDDGGVRRGRSSFNFRKKNGKKGDKSRPVGNQDGYGYVDGDDRSDYDDDYEGRGFNEGERERENDSSGMGREYQKGSWRNDYEIKVIRRFIIITIGSIVTMGISFFFPSYGHKAADMIFALDPVIEGTLLILQGEVLAIWASVFGISTSTTSSLSSSLALSASPYISKRHSVYPIPPSNNTSTTAVNHLLASNPSLNDSTTTRHSMTSLTSFPSSTRTGTTAKTATSIVKDWHLLGGNDSESELPLTAIRYEEDDDHNNNNRDEEAEMELVEQEQQNADIKRKRETRVYHQSGLGLPIRSSTGGSTTTTTAVRSTVARKLSVRDPGRVVPVEVDSDDSSSSSSLDSSSDESDDTVRGEGGVGGGGGLANPDGRRKSKRNSTPPGDVIPLTIRKNSIPISSPPSLVPVQKLNYGPPPPRPPINPKRSLSAGSSGGVTNSSSSPSSSMDVVPSQPQSRLPAIQDDEEESDTQGDHQDGETVPSWLRDQQQATTEEPEDIEEEEDDASRYSQASRSVILDGQDLEGMIENRAQRQDEDDGRGDLNSSTTRLVGDRDGP